MFITIILLLFRMRCVYQAAARANIPLNSKWKIIAGSHDGINILGATIKTDRIYNNIIINEQVKRVLRTDYTRFSIRIII